MGPGLLEAVYRHCLVKELRLRNIKVETMVPIPLVYKGYHLNKDYVIDILIEDEIKLANKRLGFLINFNVPLLKNGFKRFVNNF